MSMTWRVLACVCILLAGSARAEEPTVPQNIVTIDSGRLEGASTEGVLSFKGIPYAAPPVGALRWKPPQPVAAWTGTRDAKSYGNDCAQDPFPFDAAPSRVPFSEDCLYLNVWRSADSTRDLPVMVWIHGGGFVNGGSSPAVYDGSNLARQGVVLVSFNYRLGRFGFFGFPALTAEDPKALHGNYGTMDQIAALKWVKANIAAFGGNPDNVTVFGESAGGASVHMLLTTSLAAGLFNKAVIESGGGRGGLTDPRRLSEDLPDLPSAETIGVNFAKANGIEGTGADALAALRALPADKVVAGLGLMTVGTAMGTTYPGPIVDGELVTEMPDQAYRAGRMAKVPIIVGANDADIGFTNAKTMDDALAPFGADKDKAVAAYDPDHTGDVHVVAHSIAMDQLMIEPARLTAELFSDQGLPAFEYRFSYVAPAAAAAFDASPLMAQFGVKGAQHASEIPFVFDTVAAAYGNATTQADEAMAKAMSAYWTAFAKTGSPGASDLPAWPAYTRSNDTLMNFTPDGPKAMPDPWRDRLDLVAAHASVPPKGQ
jgi:para-nitrobenzyl esterase